MSPRTAAKLLAQGLANVAVSPLLLLHVLKIPLLGPDRALEGSTQLLALFPGLIGQYLRRAFLGWTISHCHPSASIGFGTIFSKSASWIGENVYIGPFCSLGYVHIARDTLIATGVHIPSGARIHGTDDLTRPIREQQGEIVCVTVGRNCWIGNGAIIMADIGSDSIIGAGAVVTNPIPPLSVAVGVPAKVLRSRATPVEQSDFETPSP